MREVDLKYEAYRNIEIAPYKTEPSLGYWFDTPSIPIGRGQLLTPFWNCFGSGGYEVTEHQILSIILNTKSNLLPVNTHRGTNFLNIGEGEVRWDWIADYQIIRDQIPCLNINLNTTWQDACSVAQYAFDKSGIDLLKLEVLHENLTVADTRQVVLAAEVLLDQGFRVLPLIQANPHAAVKLYEMGCPLVRVQGSAIGSGNGILWPAQVKACAEAVPTILDCGIGSVDHILKGMELGCKGFLVNHMLFKDGQPVKAVKDLRKALIGG